MRVVVTHAKPTYTTLECLYMVAELLCVCCDMRGLYMFAYGPNSFQGFSYWFHSLKGTETHNCTSEGSLVMSQ